MRVSCTQLESFRLFMDPSNEWMSEADLIAAITGDTPDTPAIALGRAFESVLTAPDTYRVPGGYRCEDYSFADTVMAAPLALVDPGSVFQAKTVQRYGAVDVVAKADAIAGATIHEWKTTTSSFDVEKYLTSCQHRFLLDAFEALRVTYHVFLLDDHGNGVIELRGVESFNVYPYPACHQDCQALVDRFIEYVTMRGLDGVLRQRQMEAA